MIPIGLSCPTCKRTVSGDASKCPWCGMDFEAYKEAAEPLFDLLFRVLFFFGLFFAPAFIFNWLAGRTVSSHAFPGVIFGTLGDKTSWLIGGVVWGTVAVIYFWRKNRSSRSRKVDESVHQPRGKKLETRPRSKNDPSHEASHEIGATHTQDAASSSAEGQELSQLRADLVSLEAKIEAERNRYSRAVENFNRLAEIAVQPAGKKTMASFGCKLASDDIEELSRTIPALEAERYRLVARIVELQSAAWPLR